MGSALAARNIRPNGERGEMRATGSTRMNELSSRSHAVFIIIAEQSETTYVDDEGNKISPEQFHDMVATGIKAARARSKRWCISRSRWAN